MIIVEVRSTDHLESINSSGVNVLRNISATEFRLVLGHFCSGLTIIAAMTEDGPVGFTCQSFSSLSLEPPLVVFCPAKSSSTWPRIRDIGHFCVNVLATHQEELSASFARSGADKFKGVDFDFSPNGSPLLPGSAAWIDCSLHAEYDGGDHVMSVGAVQDLAADGDSRPLLFHRGRYARVS